ARKGAPQHAVQPVSGRSQGSQRKVGRCRLARARLPVRGALVPEPASPPAKSGPAPRKTGLSPWAPSLAVRALPAASAEERQAAILRALVWGREGCGRSPWDPAANLAVGQATLLVEFDDSGLGIGPQLRGSGTQGVGRLQGMASLNAT